MRNILFAISPLFLAACTDTVISTGAIGGLWGRRDIPVTYTTADVRMITERADPLNTGRKLVCSEPAPDVAKALANAAQATVTAKGGGAVNVGVSGGYSSAEALLELAGRSTALLGLRDGLFRACEAYANGAIGDDAYALVLSRYGQVMVTLFLSQDIASAARGTGSSVAAPLISAGGGAANSGTGGGTSGGGGSPGSAGGAAGGTKVSSRIGGTGWQGLLREAVYAPGGNAGGLEAGGPGTGGLAAPAQADAAAGGLPGGAGVDIKITPIAPSATKGATTPPVKDPNSTPIGNGVNAQAALAIQKLGEDYFGLDTTYVHTLMTACINEYDATRPNEGLYQNEFLHDHVCRMLDDPIKLEKFIKIISSPAAVVPGGAGAPRKPVVQHPAH